MGMPCTPAWLSPAPNAPVVQTDVVPLTASVTTHDSGPEPYTLVELAGEADVTGSETLHTLLEAQTRKRPSLLIIEMSALRFMDSSALQAILRANLALGKNGGRLALVSPHDTVARVLEITEVDRLVPVYASVAEAASR
jgi:anti-sigma B factor antagonist